MAWIDTDALKRGHPVEDVIEGYGVELRRSGCGLIGRCPFHEDGGRPNLYVYPSTRSWYCYRCGLGGDVIRFVERIERIGFRDAVTRLTGERSEVRSASRHPRVKLRSRGRSARDPDERACLAAAVELYHNRLLTDEAALAYVQRRGVDRRIIERCRLGYAAGDELTDYLRWRRLSIQAAMRVGLLRRDGLEFLAGRVTVPEIRDGEPIWLIGRTINAITDCPKYLGLPGGKPLLGWDVCKDSPEVFLVEGVFDWLTLLSWGYPALALVGTHVRSEVMKILTQFERVFLALDNDEAGRAAAENFIRELKGRAVILTLADVNDIADLARYSAGVRLFAEAVHESGQKAA